MESSRFPMCGSLPHRSPLTTSGSLPMTRSHRADLAPNVWVTTPRIETGLPSRRCRQKTGSQFVGHDPTDLFSGQRLPCVGSRPPNAPDWPSITLSFPNRGSQFGGRDPIPVNQVVVITLVWVVTPTAFFLEKRSPYMGS